MKRTATCCCGQCCVEVEGEPALNAVCHCSNCKRRTGSAFGWSAYFADAQLLRQTGDLRLDAFDGENPQRRWFCGHCGSTLLWKASFMPGRTGIAGGCFADPPLAAPSMSATDGGRCPWVSLPQGWRVLP